jgi:DNA-dependent RNA polymerase auxiliary subunit epsilon
MKIGFATNAYGEVLALSDATTNVKDAYYLSTGDDEKAIEHIGRAGFEYIEMLDGNLLRYENDAQAFRASLQKKPGTIDGCVLRCEFHL